jgi:catechol 2,3-dioxygenase-like lactoylglutathione lyase family enzyme
MSRAYDDAGCSVIEETAMLSGHRVYATIPAADLARATKWYEDHLGLKPSEVREDGARYMLADGTGFMIYPTQNAGKAPNTLMTFLSTDARGDIAALQKKGVVFEEYDMPGLKTENGVAMLGGNPGGWFKDADGNILGIFES